MFTRLQHVLKAAQGRQISLSTPVHVELTLWRQLVSYLKARPMHPREIIPPPPVDRGDGRLSPRHGRTPSREWNLWRLEFSTVIRTQILTDTNPKGFLTIKDLELVAYITHL